MGPTSPIERIQGMKEVSDLIQAHTYPPLRYGDDARPIVFASCVFLQVDDSILHFGARVRQHAGISVSIEGK